MQKSYEIGVDVACLFTERTETVHKLYEKFGYAYLNRDVYYIKSFPICRTISYYIEAYTLINRSFEFHFMKTV